MSGDAVLAYKESKGTKIINSINRWWWNLLWKKFTLGPIVKEESNLVKHAKREFVYAGYIPLEDEQEDDPNKWMQENILELLQVFGDQGHSGTSAPYAIRMFQKLADFKPLGPIKCTDDEWALGESFSNNNIYQNKRLSSVFKEGKDGPPYYLEAIVWNETGEHSGGFTGTVDGISSSQAINLPFTPKTFYIDVISKRWADKEETKEDPNGDWWTHKIKYPTQLEEVWMYYKKPEL